MVFNSRRVSSLTSSLAIALYACAGPLWAQPVSSARSATAHPSSEPHSLEPGAVLNASWQSIPQALSHRDKGWGLGHSDISLDATLSPALLAKFSAVAHSDHHRVASHIEEAFLEAPGLAGGLQLRGGRFLSQIGYLNEQHPHSDDFVMRPLLHRAFLGGHYYDNGVRLNWIAPTALYWRLGAEVFEGKRLASSSNAGRAGAFTLSSRWGGDLGRSSSWQAGLSTLRHRSGANGEAGEVEHHSGSGSPSGEEHESTSHRAAFFGRQIDSVDLVWKWAPDGNARARQLRLSAEFARARGVGDAADPASRSRQHHAWYVSAVYRFHAQWEAGIRFDRLNALALHDPVYEKASLEERSASLTWKPDHSSAIRIQWSGQRDLGGFAEASHIAPGRAAHLQFIRSFGAHGAHAF